MEDITDIFYNIKTEIELEYNKALHGVKELPSKDFKFTSHLGYEYEIIIENIQLLNYPLIIGDTYIKYFIKEIPSFIKGIKYDIILLYNGSGNSKRNQFSDIDKLYGSLITDFYYLFGENYFDTNFIRGIGREESEE